MVGADGHPAGVRGQVIDPVRHRLARAVPGEVMGPGRRRLALGPPLAARVLELADQLLLLGVHADHRIGGVLVGLDLLVDVPELRVPVRVPLALDRLGVALQAEPLGPQQVTDGVGADPVALAGQLGRQVAGRLGGPPQRRHRITPLLRLHQGQQRRAQPRIQISGPLAPAARPPRPAQRLCRRSPAHRRPGTPWPRGPRRPGPPAGSRRAPAPGPRRPSAAAAAAHPGAGRSPRTSPPEPALLPRCRPYHISMPHSRKLRVIFLQALNGRDRHYGGQKSDFSHAGTPRIAVRMPRDPLERYETPGSCRSNALKVPVSCCAVPGRSS